MMRMKLTGLIAATYTPLHENGSLNLAQVAPMVERLIGDGVDGLYVCGSTGEGVSLSSSERRSVAEAYVTANAGRLPVVIQVGHNSLAEARELAAHAQLIGADAISANAPSYFKITAMDLLIESMAQIADGAPDLPFYYYHIPSLTGADLDMVEFLQRAGDRIGNLVGLKFTTPQLHTYQQCVELDGGRWNVLWGCDEMLLAALAVGCRGAVGSTYNLAAPVYRRLIDAFHAGALDQARAHQQWAIQMIRTIGQYPFHPAMKRALGMVGLDLGPCRLPQARLTAQQVHALRLDLEAIDFFNRIAQDQHAGHPAP